MASGPVFELAVHSVFLGRRLTNTLHFELFTASEEASLESIMDVWEDNCKSQWLSISTSEVLTDFLTCRVVPPPGESGLVGSERAIDTPGTYGGSSDLLPPEITCRATFRTSLAGRRWRGRSFFSGGLEGDMTVNGWTIGGTGMAARVAEYLLTVLNAFDASGPTDPGRWVVYSEQQRRETPGDAFTANVTSYLVRAQPTLLRSRRS